MTYRPKYFSKRRLLAFGARKADPCLNKSAGLIRKNRFPSPNGTEQCRCNTKTFRNTDGSRGSPFYTSLNFLPVEPNGSCHFND